MIEIVTVIVRAIFNPFGWKKELCKKHERAASKLIFNYYKLKTKK